MLLGVLCRGGLGWSAGLLLGATGFLALTLLVLLASTLLLLLFGLPLLADFFEFYALRVSAVHPRAACVTGCMR